MLVELRVRQLGVVEDASLLLGQGMTAITGETGAGKTMLTEAIRLLTGGRAEPQMVRTGAAEATIEGRFVSGEEEAVVSRVIPADGRSRAYVDGRMVPVSALFDLGRRLVDLHGQHAHQALLSGSAQRAGLDGYGGVDVDSLQSARRAIVEVEAELDRLGGDSRARAREIDLLRFQLEELDAAELSDADEDVRLRQEEEVLAGAVEHRLAGEAAYQLLSGDGGVTERLAEAVKLLSSSSPMVDLHERMVSVASEIDDLSSDLSTRAESMSDDPERLAEVQNRRAALKQLERKYGPTLSDVLAYRADTVRRIEEFERHDEVVAALEARREAARQELTEIEKSVLGQRRAAAPKLAKTIEGHLQELALPKARFGIAVAGAAGDDVVFELSANPGMPLLPVAKAASGGELARTMLAMRLALLEASQNEGAPDTLVFDEVDAGIGGEAAIAVGQALSRLGRSVGMAGQVFVVTHLAQVAAFADAQFAVEKTSQSDTTVAVVRPLDDSDRETELARMLSGRPESPSGRAHARELLDAASAIDLTAKKVSKRQPRTRSLAI